MASLLNRFFFGGIAALALTACASSVPSNFQYETSLRGEQGFIGQADRVEAAETLLSAGVVTDPALALRAALPGADVKVQKWGLRYFSSNWERYQVVLDADIRNGEVKTKCREVSTKTPAGASTLKALLADDGIELQRQMIALIRACAAKQN